MSRKRQTLREQTQWVALCGLLLAALTLGRPRDVPETSRDSAPRPVVRVVPAWNGFQAERNVY